MIKVSFLGDISLNGTYNLLYERGENPFLQIGHELEQSDFVVGNLECFARGEKGENINKIPRLFSELKTLNYLKNIYLTLVTTANNHVYDNLEDGYKKTIDFINKNNIAYIGSGYSEEEASMETVINIKGKRFCFLNYVTLDTNPKIPENATIRINYFDEYEVINDIKRNKANDFIIILLHWGGRFEGCLYPDPELKPISRKLIDAGADLIIGHHSHTFQPFEFYKGKFIFYSLGNFCFSDVESDNIRFPLRGRNRESAILHVEFENESFKPKFVPIYNNHCHISINEKIKNKINRRQSFYTKFSKLGPVWKFYVQCLNIIDPLTYRILSNNQKRSFSQRLKGLSISKIKEIIYK